MIVNIPFGTSFQPLDINHSVSVEVLQSRIHNAVPESSEDDIVRRSMESPIGSLPLWELARGKKRAVILCSDHTRPVPSKRIIPHMLRELRDGNPDISVTLLVATGFHRATTQEELILKFGEDIVEKETILVHDCQDEKSLCRLGVLPSGAPLIINRAAAEADLLVSEGFIEPHFFAGFSGGRKSVLPGVCGRATVLGNHCSAFIDSPRARTGVLEGNPIHRDMEAAARMAGLAYLVNVVLNQKKQVIASFAGCPEQAHAEGCAYLRGLCRAGFRRPGDIVVTSNGGAPLDQNLYQAVKGLTAAEAAAAPGAVLILCASCYDGAGGEGFYRAFRDCENPAALLEKIRGTPMEKTAPDQWEVQILARILARFRVILVCNPAMWPVAEEMGLETSETVQSAFEQALEERGGDARVTVIPDGVSVMVEKEN